MSQAWDLPPEPWRLREVGFDAHHVGRTESLFALSNGFLGVRGTFDEGEPCDLPGTYLNGCHESYPLSYAEAGYGYPESGELMINVTDGKPIRLFVDDEPLDLREGQILDAERVLDFRTGVLHRAVRWQSPAGIVVHLTSRRLVSLTHRGVLAVDYRVEAINAQVQLTVHSELRANQAVEETSGNPALTEVVKAPLVAEQYHRRDERDYLVHRTRRSGWRVAAAAEHRIASTNVDVDSNIDADCAVTIIRARAAPGEYLHMSKFVAYGCSPTRSVDGLRDEVDAALTEALAVGWDGLIADQRRRLDAFWKHADVEVDGDVEVQQGVRFGLFQLLQASARAEQRPLAAKGLTGTGYSGHAFWETEMFVLPVLTAVAAPAAAGALEWRHSTLTLARERAATLRLRGAAMPWRTISGRECGAYWPAGTAAFHVNADVAAAVSRYVTWTDDREFQRRYGLELLIETARLWMSLGYRGADGDFHLDGVTGPDEYSALVNDNTYTNLMAAQNLREAARAARRWPADASSCQVSEKEIRTWSEAADAMAVPHDAMRDVPQQYREASSRQCWDFDATAETDSYPLEEHFPYVEIYRKQVAKQADLVLALHWCGDCFEPDVKARAFAGAEQITVRDSSLSACSQAVLAAEVGHLELAHAYVREASLMDLDDLHHDTDDGLHLASLAGAWIGLVCGFGGLRDHGDRLCMSPRLPNGLTRLSFRLNWRGVLLHVTIEAAGVTYAILGSGDVSVTGQPPTGGDLEFLHHGELIRLSPHQPVHLRLPAIPDVGPVPSQPAGRRPGVAQGSRQSGC